MKFISVIFVIILQLLSFNVMCMSINVDISTQKLYLINNGEIIEIYKISSSKYGEGNVPNSNKTPLGTHILDRKNMIGDGAKKLTIFKSRINTGKLATYNMKGAGDLVTTRIMWLQGAEAQNSNSYKRYIYIHGTADVANIGTKASHGCIRMYNDDAVKLFNTLKNYFRINQKIKQIKVYIISKI